MFELKPERFNLGGKKSTSIRFDSIWAEKIHPSRETKVQARTQKWKKKGSRGTGIFLEVSAPSLLIACLSFKLSCKVT